MLINVHTKITLPWLLWLLAVAFCVFIFTFFGEICVLFVCGGISLFGYFVLNLFGKKNLTVLYVNRLNSVQGSETAELFFFGFFNWTWTAIHCSSPNPINNIVLQFSILLPTLYYLLTIFQFNSYADDSILHYNQHLSLDDHLFRN